MTTTSKVATVEVPFEALVEELGAKRAIKFLQKLRENYGDSVIELRRATENLTIEEIETEIKKRRRATA